MSELCEACRAFKISRAAFLNHSGWDKTRVQQLGYFYDVEKRTYCPLCVLVTTAYRNGPIQQNTAFEGSRVQGVWARIGEDSNQQAAELQFHLIGKFMDMKIPLSVRIVADEAGQPIIGSARLINPSSTYLPFDEVKNWLTQCESTHKCRPVPLSATRNGRLPDSFTVIDVLNHCLVQPTGACRFFALSYMWGSSNRFISSLQTMQDLAQTGSLGSIWTLLAPPIRDAIELIRRLGERYIWVDAICIPQSGENSAEIRMANVQSMDSIYRHAVCTIIAADDTSPDAGLAGVQNRERRSQQLVTEIVPGVRALARFSPDVYLVASKYRTRGWTFQEEQLATRSIILAADQVYFSCSMSTCSEDVDPAPSSIATFASYDRLSKIIDHHQAATNPPQTYFSTVEAYTARQLRFSSDILQAFAGVGAVHSQILQSELLEGIPAYLLDAALLWQPYAKVTRRNGFPSWSWAGWEGRVQWLADTLEGKYYGDPGAALKIMNDWMLGHTWIAYFQCDEDDNLRSIPRTDVDLGISSMFWPVEDAPESASSGYHAYIQTNSAVSDDVYHRYTNMSRPPLHLLPSGALPRQSLQDLAVKVTGLRERNSLRPLFFTTCSARFAIKASSTSYIRYGSVDPVWDNRGRLVFLLYAKSSDHHPSSYVDDNPCGYVLLDDEFDTAQNDLSEQQFLLMSEANYNCEYGRPHERHNYKKFYGYDCWEEVHVMMVKHHQLSSGVSVTERLGLGRVLREVVMDAKKVDIVDVALV